MKGWRISLQVKFCLLAIFVLLLAFVPSLWYASEFSRQAVLEAERRNFDSMTTLVRANIQSYYAGLHGAERPPHAPGPQGTGGSWSVEWEAFILREIQDELDALTEDCRRAVGILSGQGKLLAVGEAARHAGAPDFPPELLAEARQGKVVEMREEFHSEPHDGLPAVDNLLYRIAYIPELDWFLVTAANVGTLKAPGAALAQRMALTGLAAVLLSIAGALLLTRRLVRPLRHLTNEALLLAATDFSDTHLPRAFTDETNQALTQRRDEVGSLAQAFAHMGKSLHTNVRRLMDMTAAKERLQGELNAARQIQRGILPVAAHLTQCPGLAVAAELDAAQETAGDLYDVLPLPGGKTALIIGDVSGKGMPAALFMTMTVSLTRAALLQGLAPAAVLDYVNTALAASNPQSMFVTLWVGIFDPASGMLEYANGGHCPPLLWRNTEGAVEELEHLAGPLLGIFEGEDYTGARLLLASGDLCLLYSDGVTEAMNATQELFGLSRLRTCFGRHTQEAPATLLTAILAEVAAFRGRAEVNDDSTLLCFTRS